MSKKSNNASDNTDKAEKMDDTPVSVDQSSATPLNKTIKDDGASKKENTTEETSDVDDTKSSNDKSDDKKEGVDSAKSSDASKEDTPNVTPTGDSEIKDANSVKEESSNSKNIDKSNTTTKNKDDAKSTDKKESVTNNVSTSTTPHQQHHSFQQQTEQQQLQYQSFSDMQDDLDDGYTDSNDTLLTMSFNQDGGCLAVGTGSGFRICNVHPFEENLRRTLGGDTSNNGGSPGDGGIAHIEMLYRTNLLAITGHSNSPHFPPNKVLMYDDHLQRTVGDLSFRQKVLTTKLRRDRIVVVLRDRTYIYNFADMTLLDKVYTGENPHGLVAISIDNGGVGGSTVTGVERAENVLGSGRSSNSQQRNNGMVLAVPSTQKGQVRVELYGLRRQTFIDAHDSQLGALALSVDGSLLATASERGTVIRLFDTRGVTIGGGSSHGSSRQDATSVSSSVPLREFRRGVERATITCLTFSLDSTWLGCASDHGTVHVFQTHGPNDNKATEKKTRSSSMTGKAIRMLPKLVTSPKKYIGMDGVHSYAQVRGVPHPYACAFVPDREQTIAVAGMDEYGNGCLLLAEFGKLPISGITVSDTKVYDSEARRVGYHRFFKSKNPSASHTTSRRRTKSKDFKPVDVVEGGAYIDQNNPIDLKMNHIKISDEDEDGFAAVDYNAEK